MNRSIMVESLKGSRLTRWLDAFLIALIALNVVAACLATIDSFEQRHRTALIVFETFSVIVFTIEYALRFVRCGKHPSGRFSGKRGHLIFLLSPLAIIDLLAILPFYLGALTTLDLRFLRVLRLTRVFKLTRYSSAMTILLRVLREELPAFGAALFILLLVLIFASSGMYLMEQDDQPEAFGSIPDAMWWAVATLTTVGYGDVTPITPWGKLFGSLVTIVGIGMVALPAGILASAFSEQLRRSREAFKAEVAIAMEDGVLSDLERGELEDRRRELGLPASAADAVLDQWNDACLLPGAEIRCPSCQAAIPIQNEVQLDPSHGH